MSVCVLGLPSKGRMQEQTLAFLEDCGLALQQSMGERAYTARLDGAPELEVRLMSATEIAKALVAGDIHAGVTGEDVLREAEPSLGPVTLLKPLGFGHADLVVAVPAGWLDVSHMADLVDICAAHRARTGRRLRVATKYLRLAADFLEQHAFGDYRLVESAGATEGAPAIGTAEIIIDISTTGRTLAANGLQVLRDGVILRSQAHLAVSIAALWDAPAKAAFARLLDILEARSFAKARALVRVEVAPAARAAALQACRGFMEEQPPPALDGLGFYCARTMAIDAARQLAPFASGPVGIFEPRFVFGGPAPAVQKFRALFGDNV
jgi:ATP phosphoribosyltransferase